VVIARRDPGGMAIIPAKPHLVIRPRCGTAAGCGPMFIKLYADCTGSPVDSVIRDAAALAYDDPPS